MIMYGESPSLSEKKEYDVIVDLQPITNHPKSHACSICSTVTRCFVSIKSMEILRDKTIEYQYYNRRLQIEILCCSFFLPCQTFYPS